MAIRGRYTPQDYDVTGLDSGGICYVDSNNNITTDATYYNYNDSTKIQTIVGDIYIDSDTGGLSLGDDQDIKLTSNAPGVINITPGAADTDITVNFVGTSNSGQYIWDEDLDYFKFMDNMFMDGARRIYFGVTDCLIQGDGEGALIIAGGGALQISATNGNVSIPDTIINVQSLDVDTLNLNDNVITDSTGTISFDDENLTTTGNGSFGELLTIAGTIYTTAEVVPPAVPLGAMYYKADTDIGLRFVSQGPDNSTRGYFKLITRCLDGSSTIVPVEVDASGNTFLCQTAGGIRIGDDTVPTNDLEVAGDTVLEGNLTIGSAAAGVSYTLTLHDEDDDCVITYDGATNILDLGSTDLQLQAFVYCGGFTNYGDTDTFFQFGGTNQFQFNAGGWIFQHFTKAKTGLIEINEDQNDIDYTINTTGINDFFKIDADNDTLVIGDGGVTNYTQFSATGNIVQYGSAGFYPRRIAQAAEPTPSVGEQLIWRDTDDGKVYLIYNDTDSESLKVELT